jgi:hypothetical protein
MNQLGFPLHFVKIFDGGACFDTHGNLSSPVWGPLGEGLLQILVNVGVLPPPPRVNALGDLRLILRLLFARYIMFYSFALFADLTMV